MNDLTLQYSPPRRAYKPEPPSYYEYHARRPLRGDKNWQEYHKALMRTYHVAQLEACLRRYVADNCVKYDE